MMRIKGDFSKKKKKKSPEVTETGKLVKCRNKKANS